jgi:hypothetical protein
MNTIKRFVWFAAGLAAVATVITVGTERRAIAQVVRAALVRNQDEPGRNPYSQNTSCFGTGCSLTFPAVPAGERLVVTFVNAGIGGSGGSPLLLAGHGQDARYFATTNSTLSVVNSPVVAYYDAGETPTLTCSCSSLLLESTLSGYYVALP